MDAQHKVTMTIAQMEGLRKLIVDEFRLSDGSYDFGADEHVELLDRLIAAAQTSEKERQEMIDDRLSPSKQSGINHG